MAETFDGGYIIASHIILFLLQMTSLGLLVKDYFNDRLMIGLLSFTLIIVSVISGSFAIEMTVLASLGISLIVRGSDTKNRSSQIFGIIILLTFLASVSYFAYCLDLI